MLKMTLPSFLWWRITKTLSIRHCGRKIRCCKSQCGKPFYCSKKERECYLPEFKKCCRRC